MRFPRDFSILACDFDGTLANDGHVDLAAVKKLRAVRESGRKVVLITGRQLEDLRTVAPDLSLFDVIVAENGAVVFSPAEGGRHVLASPASEALRAALRVALDRRGVKPLEVGEVVISTRRRNLRIAREVLGELAVDWHIVLNKNSVMILPCGVDKASGLRQVLQSFAIPASQVVGVGDAENDEAFLAVCGFAAAVANALPSVKRKCDYVTRRTAGAGVAELVEKLLRKK